MRVERSLALILVIQSFAVSAMAMSCLSEDQKTYLEMNLDGKNSSVSLISDEVNDYYKSKGISSDRFEVMKDQNDGQPLIDTVKDGYQVLLAIPKSDSGLVLGLTLKFENDASISPIRTSAIVEDKNGKTFNFKLNCDVFPVKGK